MLEKDYNKIRNIINLAKKPRSILKGDHSADEWVFVINHDLSFLEELPEEFKKKEVYNKIFNNKAFIEKCAKFNKDYHLSHVLNLVPKGFISNDFFMGLLEKTNNSEFIVELESYGDFVNLDLVKSLIEKDLSNNYYPHLNLYKENTYELIKHHISAYYKQIGFICNSNDKTKLKNFLDGSRIYDARFLTKKFFDNYLSFIEDGHDVDHLFYKLVSIILFLNQSKISEFISDALNYYKPIKEFLKNDPNLQAFIFNFIKKNELELYDKYKESSLLLLKCFLTTEKVLELAFNYSNYDVLETLMEKLESNTHELKRNIPDLIKLLSKLKLSENPSEKEIQDRKSVIKIISSNEFLIYFIISHDLIQEYYPYIFDINDNSSYEIFRKLFIISKKTQDDYYHTYCRTPEYINDEKLGVLKEYLIQNGKSLLIKYLNLDYLSFDLENYQIFEPIFKTLSDEKLRYIISNNVDKWFWTYDIKKLFPYISHIITCEDLIENVFYIDDLEEILSISEKVSNSENE